MPHLPTELGREEGALREAWPHGGGRREVYEGAAKHGAAVRVAARLLRCAQLGNPTAAPRSRGRVQRASRGQAGLGMRLQLKPRRPRLFLRCHLPAHAPRPVQCLFEKFCAMIVVGIGSKLQEATQRPKLQAHSTPARHTLPVSTPHHESPGAPTPPALASPHRRDPTQHLFMPRPRPRSRRSVCVAFLRRGLVPHRVDRLTATLADPRPRTTDPTRPDPIQTASSWSLRPRLRPRLRPPLPPNLRRSGRGPGGSRDERREPPCVPLASWHGCVPLELCSRPRGERLRRPPPPCGRRRCRIIRTAVARALQSS